MKVKYEWIQSINYRYSGRIPRDLSFSIYYNKLIDRLEEKGNPRIVGKFLFNVRKAFDTAFEKKQKNSITQKELKDIYDKCLAN